MHTSELIVAVVRAWRRIALTAIGVAAAVSIVTLIRPRSYSSSATFVPSSGGGMTQFAGLASQLGVSLPGDAGGLSSEFYADFMSSIAVLKWVVGPDTAWGTTPVGVAPEIATKLGNSEPNAAMQQWQVTRAVKEMLTVSADPISRVVRLRVSSEDPALSAYLAERLVRSVELFNAVSRQNKAREDALFAEARMTEARRDLEAAEGRVGGFLARNRSYASSAMLTIEYDRLVREAGFARTTYAALVQASEQARIESLRNAPMITRVESPVAAGIPDRRYLLLKGLVALVAGAAVAICLIGGRELLRGVGMEFPELARAWEEIGREIRATIPFGKQRDAST